MADEFDELEKEIMAEMKKIYSETAVDHAMNPKNFGDIPNADGFASSTSSCEETMKIWLRVKDGKILEATFWTNGCSPTVACGSIATEIIKGKDIAQALAITQTDIIQALNGLPESNQHCALLAVNAVKAAIQDYITLKREPWRKAYRKY